MHHQLVEFSEKQFVSTVISLKFYMLKKLYNESHGFRRETINLKYSCARGLVDSIFSGDK